MANVTTISNTAVDKDETLDNNSTTHSSYDYYYDYSAVEKATIVCAQVCGIVSLLSGICILVESVADLRSNGNTNARNRRNQSNSKKTVARILISWSVGVLSYSIASIMGSFVAPSEGIMWGAFGTTATCTLQGVLSVIGILITACWDMILSITYVGMVCYEWGSAGKRKTLTRWEVGCHVVVWPFVTAFLIASLITQSYNPDGEACFLGVGPHSCWNDDDDDDPFCTRGADSYHIFATLLFWIMFLAILVGVVSMTMLYCHVRKQERRNEQYTKEFELSRRRSMTRSSRFATPPSDDGGDGNNDSLAAPSEAFGNRENDDNDDAEPPTLANNSSAGEERSDQPQSNNYQADDTNNARDTNAPNTSSPSPQTRRRSSTTPTNNNNKRKKMSHQVALQGIWYSSVWIFALLPTIVVNILDEYADVWSDEVFLFTSTIATLYGFWFLLIFLKRRETIKTRYGKLVKAVLCCGCCNK